MTNEQAKSELMQIYGSLSEEKKKALDVAFKAMEQSMPTMVYPQVDGITPTVVAQADGEKNCFNCKWYPDNDITKGFDEVCHKCSNSDKWEGLIKRVPWEDIAPPPKIPEAQADGEKTCGTCRNEDTYHCAECENKSDYEQAQADGEYVLKKDVMGCIGQTSLHWELARKLRKLPSVAIPSAEPNTGHWIFQKIIHGKRMWCSNCDSSFDLCCNQIKRYDEATKKEYLWSHCPWCGAKMVEPQESEE